MRNRHSHSFKPTLETLGDRVLPAIDLIGGNIMITSGAGDDNVVVTASGQHFIVFQNAENGVFPQSQVTGKVIYQGGAGRTRFENYTWLRTEAHGGAGADSFYGGSGDDTLMGGLGEDLLVGGGGRDTLYANDAVGAYADVSANRLYGDDGADTLHGADGADVLDTGTGSDTAYGNGGNDNLYGGLAGFNPAADFNLLSGGAGNDNIYGGRGTDILDGGADHDLIYGQGGGDWMNGGSGNDVLTADRYSTAATILIGGDGNDTLHAGSGRDRLQGDTGRDELYGYEGDDDLDGGDDGISDKLVGGSGRDRFQKDRILLLPGPWPIYGNLDAPTDFNSYEDTYYNYGL